MNRFNFSKGSPSPENRKKPDVIKKKGTAILPIMRVKIKSPVSLKEESGDVWIATTSSAAKIRK